VDATGEKPVLNQIELHPYFSQLPLRHAHNKIGIKTQS
jgi:2,5-diketo-D-gluconate reductase A